MSVSYTHLDVYKRQVHEQLPWHSTISRTRGLYGEEVFLNLFKEVLRMCVSKGMVRGKRQAVDSVFTVSYTHLDVYKRQAGISTVCIQKRGGFCSFQDLPEEGKGIRSFIKVTDNVHILCGGFHHFLLFAGLHQEDTDHDEDQP